MRKLLYMLSVLCTISTFSIAQVNSMSLGKALSSSDLELEFGKGGTIWCEYANGYGFPYPGFIDKKEYEYSGNTYYIPVNTVELVRNTCRGGGNIPSLFASIKGNENISLQYISNNNKVSNSTTFTADNDTYNSLLFAGNNTKFTGTLYLHPAITNLKFASKKSVITNISVPDVVPNTGKDKNINPFLKSRNYRILCLYLPDNKDFGRLNINGNVTVDLINNCNRLTYLSFTEINKSSIYSLAVHNKIDLIINKYNDDYYNKCKCKCHKNNHKLLRDININCEEYKQYKQSINKQPLIEKNATLNCNVLLKFDMLELYNSKYDRENYTFYFDYLLNFGKMNIKTKSTIKNSISLIRGKDFNDDTELFNKVTNKIMKEKDLLIILKKENKNCYSDNKYKYNFNKINIILQSKICTSDYCNNAMLDTLQYQGQEHSIDLLCSYCIINSNFNSTGFVYINEDNPLSTTVTDYKYATSNAINKNGKYYCNKCNKELVFDKEFIDEQLKSMIFMHIR